MKRILFLILSCAASAYGQSCTTATCTAAGVTQAAVLAALPSNSNTNPTVIVNIPSGTSAWTTQIVYTVPAAVTSLTIQGTTTCTGSGDPAQNNLACTDGSIIQDNDTTDGNALFEITSVSGFVRVGGLTIEKGSGAQKTLGMLTISAGNQTRVDHNHFNSDTNTGGDGATAPLDIVGCTFGVADHNLWTNNGGQSGFSVTLNNANTCGGLGEGDYVWNQPTNFGGNNFFFVEQNTFIDGSGQGATQANDCQFTGRQVLRFNSSTNGGHYQTHPTDSAGPNRGCRATEIYGNKFTANIAGPNNFINTIFFFSSGPGIVWGNAVVQNAANPTGNGYQGMVQLTDCRSPAGTTRCDYGTTAPPAGWGQCGGSSGWDGNTNASGYPCIDQATRGQGDLLQGTFPNICNVTVNPACNIFTGQWPHQALEPLYYWLNAYAPLCCGNGSATPITAQGSIWTQNQDYYVSSDANSGTDCTGFTGATGVGCGPRASRPATCTTGVAWWSTDQGSWNQSGNGFGNGVLDKCTATNTWTNAAYVPAVYPNLLVSAPPTLVQSHTVGRENTPGGGNSYTNPQLKIALPNPTLAGNALVLGVGANSVFTISLPTDDKGNTWVAGPTTTAGGLTTASFYALNVAAGTSLVTVSFTGTVLAAASAKLSDSIQEFANIQVSGAIGPTGTASAASPTITLSSAPTLGDLVWVFGEDATAFGFSSGCASSGPALTSVTPGANFNLAAANRYQGKVTEYSTTTSSTAAGFSTSGTDTFNAVALTLHAASAGNIPTSGVRIVHEQGEWFHTATHTIQFPTQGNLLVGAWLSPDVTFTSISSSPVSTWSTGDIHPTVCCSQVFYTLSPATSLATTITPTYSGTSQGCNFLQMYDLSGGPYAHDAVTFNNGTQNTNTNLSSGVITPSHTNEFIINITGLSFHSMLATVTDGNGHTPTADFTANTKNDDFAGAIPSQLNDDDGRAHIVNADILPLTFIYNYVAIGSPAGVGAWNSVTSAFLPSPSGSVTVSPTSMNFGSVVVGGNSSAQTATLTNTTLTSITLSPVTITGANPADFSIGANNCNSGSVAANGGTCSVTMQFFPTSTGARSATLNINTSAGSFPVAMSGTGTSAVNPGVSINPASISFGNMSVGSSTPATTVTMTSTTSANLVMGTPPATITGTNPGDFSLQAVGGQCTAGQSIPQSSTCVENVVFTPTATGARSAQLNIFNNVTGSPQVVPLSGTGVGTVALNPTSINFGLLAQGQTSAGVPMTLINNTGVTLTLTSVTYTNLDFASMVNNCTGTLVNGAQCSVTTTFRPSATTGTNETGLLQIAYTGVGGSPANVTLAGTVLPPIGTPATNIFAKNLAGCGGPPKIATWCFTADRHIYISSCSGAPLVCGPYTPFTLMAQ